MASMTAYQARSVAVPYGNCTEPTNIKAGGKSYRPRFQCADCGIYRPDSSCLPAIEEHFHHPRGTEHETAHTLGAAALVTRNLPDKIDACTEAAEKVHKQLPELPTAQQTEIEEAARSLRKARAGDRHALLPLTVIDRGRGPREPINFTPVAKAAGLSNWLVYAPSVREHIEAARTQQARTPAQGNEPRSAGGATSTGTNLVILRTDNPTGYGRPTSQTGSVN
jgi:hypothetical protein